jgi:hypothetical protein
MQIVPAPAVNGSEAIDGDFDNGDGMRQSNAATSALLLRPLKVSIVGIVRVYPYVILSVAKNPELFVS